MKIDTNIINCDNLSPNILFSICFILVVSSVRSETTHSVIFIPHTLPNLELGTH